MGKELLSISFLHPLARKGEKKKGEKKVELSARTFPFTFLAAQLSREELRERKKKGGKGGGREKKSSS